MKDLQQWSGNATYAVLSRVTRTWRGGGRGGHDAPKFDDVVYEHPLTSTNSNQPCPAKQKLKLKLTIILL